MSTTQYYVAQTLDGYIAESDGGSFGSVALLYILYAARVLRADGLVAAAALAATTRRS